MRLGLLVLVACSGPAPRREAPALANHPIVPHRPCPPTPVATGHDEGVEIDAPARAELACDPDRKNCITQLSITITSCRAEPIVIDRGTYLDLHQPWITVQAAGLPRTLAFGEAMSVIASTRGEGTVRVPLRVTTTTFEAMRISPGHPPEVARDHPTVMIAERMSPPIVVTNPMRDAARRACRACNGDWGHHAMRVAIDPSPGVDNGETCRCRSRDRDRQCSDGDDCEGWCEYERFVVVGRAGSPPVDIGHAVGRCSEFTSQQSCATPIPRGARGRPPGPLALTTSCVD